MPINNAEIPYPRPHPTFSSVHTNIVTDKSPPMLAAK
jgi:hypothetical protein